MYTYLCIYVDIYIYLCMYIYVYILTSIYVSSSSSRPARLPPNSKPHTQPLFKATCPDQQIQFQTTYLYHQSQNYIPSHQPCSNPHTKTIYLANQVQELNGNRGKNQRMMGALGSAAVPPESPLFLEFWIFCKPAPLHIPVCTATHVPVCFNTHRAI